MPVIIITGLPASGKTTRAQQLVRHIEAHHPALSVVLADDYAAGVRNTRDVVYGSPHEEKMARAALKAYVERHVGNRNTIIIVDALNYIKGFRYELYCSIRLAKVLHCIVHCDINVDRARSWNSQRPEHEHRYSEQVFSELGMRYEAPQDRSRWDRPLFTVQADDELDAAAILASVLDGKAPPPHQATTVNSLGSTNFLQEMERITLDIVTALGAAVGHAVPGDELAVPHTKVRIQLRKPLNLALLRRRKRDFLQYNKFNKVEDLENIASLFVQFINNQM